MAPHVIHGILPPSPNSPALRKIEERTPRAIQHIQDRKHNPIGAVPRPVLRRVVRIRGTVRINTSPERRDVLSLVRIPIDPDKIYLSWFSRISIFALRYGFEALVNSVPIISGGFSSAHAVKWLFASWYVGFPTSVP